MRSVRFGFIVPFSLWAFAAQAQNANKLMREGLLAYKKGEYGIAMEKYNEAMKKNADRNLANYNMGAAYYKAGKPDSALMYWQSVATSEKDKNLQSKVWHNIGNSFAKQKQYDKAVDAYKRSLRLNPEDEDTRYNLAYCQRQMQQQQQQQQQQNQQQQNQEKQNEKKEENKNDKKDKQENKENMTREEAERLLNALDNKEKELHERKKDKREGKPVNPEKDW
jgi:tetratricopeptide (TPR) repeat protein